jgi:hypothetical protein
MRSGYTGVSRHRSRRRSICVIITPVSVTCPFALSRRFRLQWNVPENLRRLGWDVELIDEALNPVAWG